MKTFLTGFGTWLLTNIICAFLLKFIGIHASEELVLLLNVITISFAIFVALSIRRRQLKRRKEMEELNSVVAEEDVSSEPISPERDVFSFRLAGLYYRSDEAQKRARELISNESVFLEKDPTNPHDPNAIRVYSDDHVHLGYIPRHLCSEILAYMDETNSYVAYVDYIISGLDCPSVNLYIPINQTHSS